MVRVPNVPLSIVATVSCTGVFVGLRSTEYPSRTPTGTRACQICAGAHATYELSPQMGAGLRSNARASCRAREPLPRTGVLQSQRGGRPGVRRPAMDVQLCCSGALQNGERPLMGHSAWRTIAQAESFDDRPVSVDIGAMQVVGATGGAYRPATAATTAVVIVLVRLEVLGEVADCAWTASRHLDLGEQVSVPLAVAVLGDELLLDVAGQVPATPSPVCCRRAHGSLSTAKLTHPACRERGKVDQRVTPAYRVQRDASKRISDLTEHLKTHSTITQPSWAAVAGR